MYSSSATKALLPLVDLTVSGSTPVIDMTLHGQRQGYSAVSTTSHFRTAVLGIGGCGSNTVDHLIRSGVRGVDFICADTDLNDLEQVLGARRIQLGPTSPRVGRSPERALLAAIESCGEVSRALSSVRVLFIAAGMGGVTGSVVSTVIASVARELGILTIGVVTTPFEFESKRGSERARKALKLLGNVTNLILVVSNEKLVSVLGDDVTQNDAFAAANDVLKRAIASMNDFIGAERGIDDTAMLSAIRIPGRAVIGQATATGPFSAGVALERALYCPLLENQNLIDAKAVMVKLTCARGSLQLGEYSHARGILSQTSPKAKLFIYTVADESLGEEVRISVVATGM